MKWSPTRGEVAIMALMVLAASLACLYGYACFLSNKGFNDETLDMAFIAGEFLASGVLPVAGFRVLKNRRGSLFYWLLLFPAFLVSIVPGIVFLCIVLAAWLA